MAVKRFLKSEVFLGTLVAVLGIFTAFASYQGAMSDSDQTKYTTEGMQMLTDANAEYLTANQEIVQDYTYYDTYYLNFESKPEIAAYYESSFSEQLTASLDRAEGPFDEPYYEAMYEIPNQMFDEADTKFGLAEEFNQRGDLLQLVVLFMAVGLSFAAWASLLKEESNMRLVFAILAVLIFVVGLVYYFSVPAVQVI